MTTRSRTAFTISELLIALSISGLILTGVYRMMVTQGRGYAQQNASTDVGQTLEGAGALLSWEVRHAEMASDILASVNTDTLSVRSVQGVGVICKIDYTTGKYGIWKNGGDIEATTDDSAMVSLLGNSSWRALKISQQGTAAGMGMSQCSWTTNVRAPDLVVKFDVAGGSDTTKIIVGSVLRAFRRTKYAEVQESSRWWLERQVGSGSWGKITGPLLSPTLGGFKLAFYDTTGATVASAALVREIGITLRSQSYKQYVGPLRNSPQYRADSLTTRVYMRR
jgi:hypothetical protein